MVSSLLLPLLVTVAPALAPAPAVTATDDPPIRLWINERRLLPGDRAKVQVRTEYDGYLLVLHVDPEGRLRVLFPIDPDKDNFVRGGRKYEVRGRGGREAFEGDGKGRGAVYAAVSRDPFRLDGYVLGDHWDYKALAPSRLADDPEPELNDLVQRMAQSSFDYDLISYDVVERSVYTSYYSPRYYYGSVYDDPWCYRFSCGYYGSPYSLSIGLFFGNYYPYYYNRYYYYPYGPFFYDPYYYAPVYYPRYYPRRHYYPGYYDRYYYWDRHRYYRPYTPYRFRTADGFTTGYRDRRYDLRRSVNTVYTPPVTRVREPAVASPARRVIEGPAAELPTGQARRTVGHEQRLERGKVEARRARERDDQSRTIGPSETRRRERQPVEARRVQGREDRQPDQRSEPRLERRREEPRAVERREPRAVERQEPRAVERQREEPRRVERAPERRTAPSPDRGSRGEGRSSGRSRPDGGFRPSDGGGRRRT